MKNNITAIILAKNEEDNIQDCIASVKFCDEILVIDDMSTDKTKDLAKKAGAVVHERELKNDFAAQRNYALKKAKHDWVLYVDADERVTPELQKNITEAIQSTRYKAYRLRRYDHFWGGIVKHGEVGGAYHDGIVRLIQKGTSEWYGNVHEVYLLTTSGRLDGFLEHRPHQTVNLFLQHVNFYSTLRAQELFEKGARPSLIQLLFYPPLKFISTYFLKLGFLDGPAGFCYSFMMSFHSFLVRAKLFQYHNFNEGKKE